MRLHRETVLASMRSIFDEFAGDGGVLEPTIARDALARLRDCDKLEALRSGPQAGAPPPSPVRTGNDRHGAISDIDKITIEGPLTFDGFVEVAEAVREKRARDLRKRAGFTDAEIDRFEVLFRAHDTQRDGTLAVGELTRLLMTLGFTLRTLEEQQDILRMLEDAKKKAVEIGAASVDGEVNFWVVVQLLRTLYKRDDRLKMDKIARIAREVRFSQGEVAEFQEVFLSWYESDGRFSSEGQVQEAPAEAERKTLTTTSLVRLFRSLGMKIEPHHRTVLDAKVANIAEEGSTDRVEFVEFLRLMRWMMDTNFADITRTIPQTGTDNGVKEN